LLTVSAEACRTVQPSRKCGVQFSAEGWSVQRFGKVERSEAAAEWGDLGKGVAEWFDSGTCERGTLMDDFLLRILLPSEPVFELAG
jgi:hypothetical protein